MIFEGRGVPDGVVSKEIPVSVLDMTKAVGIDSKHPRTASRAFSSYGRGN